MLINDTYFQGILNVPNIYEVNSLELTQLNYAIDKWGTLFIQEFLGYELFNEFSTHLTGGNLNATAPQKWKNLVNGIEYTLNNKTFKWRGLIYSEGISKISIIAYFVYYMKYQNSVNTSMGLVGVEPRNGININPFEHLTTIWNEFIYMYQGTTNTNAKRYIHQGVIFDDFYCGVNSSSYVSLLQFITDNKQDYLNINAPELAVKNRYGI